MLRRHRNPRHVPGHEGGEGAKLIGGGEPGEHADGGLEAGVEAHLDVVEGVADHDGARAVDPQALEDEVEHFGVRFRSGSPLRRRR